MKVSHTTSKIDLIREVVCHLAVSKSLRRASLHIIGLELQQLKPDVGWVGGSGTGGWRGAKYNTGDLPKIQIYECTPHQTIKYIGIPRWG